MSNHPRRRLVVALSVLAIMLGVAFMPTLLAQRVAQTQQDLPLKTVTLSGKVGTKQVGPNRSNDPRPSRSTYSRTGSRPQPLSAAQRAILFKGRARAATKTFKLTPARPIFADKAYIVFVEPQAVIPEPDGGDAYFGGGSTPGSSPGLFFGFEGKAGQLYAIDISVFNNPHPAFGANGIYTLTNSNDDVTQTIPYSSGDQHITAYVTPEQNGRLSYSLQCSRWWTFYSIEVTEL